MKRADLVAIGPGECPIARKIAIVLGAPRIVNALFGEAERLGQDHFHRLGEELNDYVRWSRPSTLFSLHGLRMSEVANGTMDIAPDSEGSNPCWLTTIEGERVCSYRLS